jgi:hypothetical protein
MSKKNDITKQKKQLFITEVATIGVRTFYAVKILSTQKMVRSLEGIDNK